MDISCIICSENFNMVSDVRSTACGHVFHYDCITTWLERSSSCPQCRKRVVVYNLNRIYLNFENENDYHLKRECEAEPLRKQLSQLEIENASLKTEVEVKQYNIEELQIINLSLHEFEMNNTDEYVAEVKSKLRDMEIKNHALERKLSVYKTEIIQMKMATLDPNKEGEYNRVWREVHEIIQKLNNVSIGAPQNNPRENENRRMNNGESSSQSNGFDFDKLYASINETLKNDEREKQELESQNNARGNANRRMNRGGQRGKNNWNNRRNNNNRFRNRNQNRFRVDDDNGSDIECPFAGIGYITGGFELVECESPVPMPPRAVQRSNQRPNNNFNRNRRNRNNFPNNYRRDPNMNISYDDDCNSIF